MGKRSARQRVLEIARAVGAEVIDNDSRYAFDVTLWTPAGIRWSANKAHSLTVADFSSRPDGWQELRSLTECGTEPCTDAQCDTCHE